jgi:predicted Rossmann fold flavoprotein
MNSNTFHLIAIGGGAAGFFGAIQLAEKHPGAQILVLEKSHQVLTKVKISGGGRCNVTHACFIPKELVAHYPRGEKELLGPFHTFMSGDMLAWLSKEGVETHIEEDGRIFPVSNSSQTIIDCFLRNVAKYHIQVELRTEVVKLDYVNNVWQVSTNQGMYYAYHILMATGSSSSMWEKIGQLGHTIIPPVPSLFTFKIADSLLRELQGVSLPYCEVKITGTSFAYSGPLLITHWGLSGPAVLKLSAWAAVYLHALNYEFFVEVNWVNQSTADVQEYFVEMKQTSGKKKLLSVSEFDLPKRLWQRMLEILGLQEKNIADLSANQIKALSEMLTACRMQVKGTTKFKEEFVTAGGVDTKEVNFKTMESKLLPGLYFAGEVLNIDGITGGFNFQAAWTGAVVAAAAIANKMNTVKAE